MTPRPGNDWRIGDLAVCVSLSLGGSNPSTILSLGKTYRVSNAYLSATGELALVLEGVRPLIAQGWRADLFRKVIPDGLGEIEFVELLNRSKRRVKA